MASTQGAQFFLLLLVVLFGSAVCQPTTDQQDALKAMASAFPVLVASHGWSTSDASTACTPWDRVTCVGSDVTVIDLHGIALNANMPAAMKNLTGLVTFNISGCGVTGNLPDVSGWANIDHFDVSSNSLTGGIANLAGLNTLITVDLSSNSFTGSLVDVSTWASLTKFALRGNSFDLCTTNPNFPGGVSCDVRGQDTCSCTSFYGSCTVDTCVPVAPSSPPTEPPTAPPVAPPVAAPVTPPVAPVSPPVAPVSPPVAPVSPPVAPVAPPTAPVSPPVAPVSPPVAPVSPPTAPVSPPTAPVSPPTSPSSPPSNPPTIAPEEPVAEPQESPVAVPEISPVEEPVEAPVVASPENVTEPVTGDPTVGSILPYALCFEQSSAASAAFYFSYSSTWPTEVTIPLGSKNGYTPSQNSPTLPTVFKPGNHSGVVRIDGFLLSLKWSLNGYSTSLALSETGPFCGFAPSRVVLSFKGIVDSISSAESSLKAYLDTVMSSMATAGPINTTRIAVTVVQETTSKREATWSATVDIAGPTFAGGLYELSSLGVLNAIQVNLSSSAALMASSVSGTGISFDSSEGLDSVSRIAPTADPVSVPTSEESQPWNYKSFTGAQKAGVAIAAIVGVALLVAVALGLWWVSRPSKQGSSALTASNGANSSARGESGNTSKDTQANDAEESSKDGTSDDEDDDEDDSEVEDSEEASEEEEDEDDDDEEEDEEEEDDEEEESSGADEDDDEDEEDDDEDDDDEESS